MPYSPTYLLFNLDNSAGQFLNTGIVLGYWQGQPIQSFDSWRR